MRILISNPKYAGPPDIEQTAAGELPIDICYLDVDRPSADETWARATAIIAYDKAVMPAEFIAALKSCRIIVRGAASYEKIDIRAAGAQGIPVCNVPDNSTEEVVEHTMALLLSLARGVVGYDAALRKDLRSWNWRGPSAMRRLKGATLGVIGLGRIGTAVANAAKGFGMKVVFFDEHIPAGSEYDRSFDRSPNLPDLLSQSDFVSLHWRLGKGPPMILDQAAVSTMKRGVLLVNTARGVMLDLDALSAGLKDGTIGGAALDVLPVEPPGRDLHPLLAAYQAGERWLDGRLILTPHAAFYSPTALLEVRRSSIRTAVDFLRHGELRNCVNASFLRSRRVAPM